MDNLAYIKNEEAYWIVQAIPQSESTNNVVISIKKLSDGYTWNFTTLAFTATAASASMTWVSGEVWKRSFTPDEEDSYIVEINNKTLDVKYYQVYKAVGSTDATAFSSNSEVSIVNVALTLLGAATITSMSDSSENARRANILYDYVRDEVLRSHPWNFAVRRSTLSLLTSTPAYGWDYSHQLPTDCLRVLEVSDGTAALTKDEYKIEGDTVSSNDTTLYLTYVYRHTNPTKYDAVFTKAFAVRLAMELAFPITNDKALAKQMADMYVDIMNTAKGVDGMESSSIALEDEDYFINER